jgi:hypothetical protein
VEKSENRNRKSLVKPIFEETYFSANPYFFKPFVFQTVFFVLRGSATKRGGAFLKFKNSGEVEK